MWKIITLIIFLSLSIFFLLSFSLVTASNQASQGGAEGGAYHDYIVVGAGPAGLQLGYFLKKAGRDYAIMERANISGSFFAIYPRHRKLISINKRHTGKTNREFNLRHDWNSLLSDDYSLRFTHYSRELFPDSLTYVRYLNDFETKLGINVLHNKDIQNITKLAEVDPGDAITDVRFRMQDQHGNIFTCKTLIIATGMWSPNLPTFEGVELVEGYETVSVDAEDFEGQSVLILGRGNSAFELADRIYGSTNYVHMLGRSRVRLSWATHYVGDLRGVNNAILDTYQLKSLDGMLEAPIEELRVQRSGARYVVSVRNGTGMYESSKSHDNFALREPYDRIVRCLGFRFNDTLFSGESMQVSRSKGRKNKYPRIQYNYESVDVPGMFYAGTVTHSLDFRKAAGGFIHGFRYTVRALHHLLEKRNHNVPWPFRSGHVTDLVPFIIKRINEASGPYQMFGRLCDVIALRGDTFDYFEEFPSNLIYAFEQYTGSAVSEIIVVSLEYGANFSAPEADPFRVGRATGEPADAARSNFLHPVFYYYKQLPSKSAMKARAPWETLPRPDRLHHTVEDFLTHWDMPYSHVLPLRRFLEHCTGRDLRQFFAEDCLRMAFTHSVLPESCRRQFELSETTEEEGVRVDQMKYLSDGVKSESCPKKDSAHFSLPLSSASLGVAVH